MTANNGVLGLPGPEIPEPSHVVLNYGCSDWKRSSQRAADLYDSGKKLWEKKYLGDIESQLASSVTIKEFTVRRIDGSLVHIQNPNYGVENPIWVPYVDFREYWQLVREQPKDPPETYHCSYLPKWRNYTLLNFRGITKSPELKFQEIKLYWNNSMTCKLLRTYIETCLGARKVTKIVCFGVGDICRAPPDWMIRLNKSTEQGSETKMSEEDPAMVQHSIALTLADVCRKFSGNTIRLLAQDPSYTVHSRGILEENGFEIVGQFGAGGFSEVDEESIVFSPFPNAPVKQILADIARPALVITRGFGAFNDHKKAWADADSPRTQQMWQGYQSRDFPVSSEDVRLKCSNLHDLKLYLRIAIRPVPEQ